MRSPMRSPMRHLPRSRRSAPTQSTPPHPPGSASLLPLIWLASPALPIGGFSYSEGLEAAVDAGLVHNESSASAWVNDQLHLSLARADLPVLARALPRLETLLAPPAQRLDLWSGRLGGALGMAAARKRAAFERAARLRVETLVGLIGIKTTDLQTRAQRLGDRAALAVDSIRTSGA